LEFAGAAVSPVAGDQIRCWAFRMPSGSLNTPGEVCA
jgi:hypothetical protein